MNRDELLKAARICTAEKGCAGCPAQAAKDPRPDGVKGLCIDVLIAGLAEELMIEEGEENG